MIRLSSRMPLIEVVRRIADVEADNENSDEMNEGDRNYFENYTVGQPLVKSSFDQLLPTKDDLDQDITLQFESESDYEG
jgi:hypothetical protein